MRKTLSTCTLLIAAAAVLAGCATAAPPIGSASASSPSIAASATPNPISTPTTAATPPALPDLDASDLERIAQTRIFFGHRSVGSDIVELGVPAVYERFGVAPPDVSSGSPLGAGSAGDQWLAQTDDPRVKIDDFEEWIRERSVATASDIAFMKLGYVDILAETDLQAVFDHYRAVLDGLETDFPAMMFLHATVSPTRWDPWNNAAIERFNTLMRTTYADSGSLYDLAAVLSTCPDGTIDAHETDDGLAYVQLCADYSRDGGHLSQLGSEVAATELLRLLAAVTGDAAAG